jgi:hypothetical protein
LFPNVPSSHPFLLQKRWATVSPISATLLKSLSAASISKVACVKILSEVASEASLSYGSQTDSVLLVSDFNNMKTKAVSTKPTLQYHY